MRSADRTREHYLTMATDGTVDLSGMVTHSFSLEDWFDAFTTIATRGATGAVTVVFDQRGG